MIIPGHCESPIATSLRRSAVPSITKKPWETVFFAPSALAFDRRYQATPSIPGNSNNSVILSPNFQAQRDLKHRSFTRIHPSRIHAACEDVMRGVGWRCDQKPALSAGKRPLYRASFQSEGTAERRGLQRHAIRRSAAGSKSRIVPYEVLGHLH